MELLTNMEMLLAHAFMEEKVDTWDYVHLTEKI
jgi:hypothetical protein